MPFTSRYSFDEVVDRTPVSATADQSATTSLSNGGFAVATSSTSADGYSVSFFDAAGNATGGYGSAVGANVAIATLSDGNVVVTTTGAGGTTEFAVLDSAGAVISTGSEGTNESNTAVAALDEATGGFVIAAQDQFSGTDSDIFIRVYDASARLVRSLSVDTSGATDRNPSVVGLANGDYAVAWERLDPATGATAAWVAVYNADGDIRSAPRAFDEVGSINRNATIIALADGGFLIAYEDNGIGNDVDIASATFDASGNLVATSKQSTLDSIDSDPSATRLSNGFIVTGYANDFRDAGDVDIRGTLTTPDGRTLLNDPDDGATFVFSTSSDGRPSVSALDGNAQLVVSYTNQTDGGVDFEIFQLVRSSTGTSGSDVFVGDEAVDIVRGVDGNDTLDGGANNDELNGGDGNDTLIGGTGSDDLRGGDGNDIFYVDSQGDVVREDSGGGRDTVFASADYALGSGEEIEFLRADSGTEGLVLTGNELVQFIYGGDGSDRLDGGGGRDRLFGGDGDDTYVVGNVGVIVSEAANDGTDTVRAAGNYTLGANLENLVLTGPGGNGIGNALDNTLTGNDGNNVLDGGRGADTLIGGGGRDTYVVDNAGDVVIEAEDGGIDVVRASVSYTLTDNVENLTLGGATNVSGTGNFLNNAITGSAAANQITGLGGRDILTGGAARDTFVFTALSDSTVAVSGRDTITDFSQSETDRIDLRLIDANTTLEGDQAFRLVGTAGFSGNAGELRYEASGANTLVSGDVDGNGAADFSILLNGLVALTRSDVLL